jgi:very-short-patch-repair endonuclease
MTNNINVFRDIGGKLCTCDREIADLAARQHGVVARWQLALGDDAVQYRVRIGQLHRVHRGVYAVGHPRLTQRGRWMAAVLAYGPAALLSHRTAAMLHGLLWPRAATPHVTVPARGLVSRGGIVVHPVERLTEAEQATVDGIPATSVARTLLDLARSRDPLLRYAVEEALQNEVLEFDAIDALAGRRGIRRLNAAVAAYRPTPGWTRSRLERRFFQLMREAGLPLPAVNLTVAGYQVDMLWREQRLIVEVDGPPHEGAAARQRDPERDARLQIAGYRVYRVTDKALVNDPATVVANVRALLMYP